jgi:AcrR family transcriptional regulator
MGTRDTILDTAINLFAQWGFNGVSIREITKAVGIKESSLYNHFSSKQQMLDEIFEHLAKRFDSMSISEEEAVRHIESAGPAEFMEMCLMNFNMYFGEPKLMKIWRILSIERFGNERANYFFTTQLIDAPLTYQSAVFEAMMKKGLIKESDPKALARAFYSFILFIYLRYFEVGYLENPAENEEIREMLKAHINFISKAISK